MSIFAKPLCRASESTAPGTPPHLHSHDFKAGLQPVAWDQGSNAVLKMVPDLKYHEAVLDPWT